MVGTIHAKLATVKRFKDIIEEAPKPAVSQFKAPAPVQQQNKEDKFGMLGKRGNEKKKGQMDAFSIQPEPKKQKVIQNESNNDEYSSSEEGKWLAWTEKCQECGNKKGDSAASLN